MKGVFAIMLFLAATCRAQLATAYDWEYFNPGSTFWPTASPASPCANVYFALDTSESIRWFKSAVEAKSEFQHMKEFILNVTEALPEWPRTPDVGAVAFGSRAGFLMAATPRPKTEAASYLNKQMNSLYAQTQGQTHVGAALEMLLDGKDSFGTLPGLLPDAPTHRKKVVIIVTDGNPDDGPCAYAARLKAAGVRVAVFGVKNPRSGPHAFSVSNAQYQCVASSVNGKKLIYAAESFSALAKLVAVAASLACSTTAAPTPSVAVTSSPTVSPAFCGDVLFVLDHSESLGSKGWKNVLDVAKGMINKASRGRFAAMGYGSDSRIFFNFSSKALALSKLEKLKSSFSVMGATQLRKALDMAMKVVIPKMTSKYKLVVIITDGIPTTCVCPATSSSRRVMCYGATDYGKKLKAAGVATSIVGLGDGALVSLASNPQACLLSSTKSGKQPLRTCSNCLDSASATKAFIPSAGTLMCSSDLYPSKGTDSPTASPTRNSPTGHPTPHPTRSPTRSPTLPPTIGSADSPTGHPTRFPTRSPTKGSPVSPEFCGDALFIIDHSESVGSTAWKVELGIVESMVKATPSGRFAAIGYGSDARIFFGLSSRAVALAKLKALKSSFNVFGATRLDLALTLAMSSVIPKMTAKYKHAIIVTDGIPSVCVCPSTSTQIRGNMCRGAADYGEKLKSSGVAVSMVGLGSGAIVSLSTNPQTCLPSSTKSGKSPLQLCPQCFDSGLVGQRIVKAFEVSAAKLMCSADLVYPSTGSADSPTGHPTSLPTVQPTRSPTRPPTLPGSPDSPTGHPTPLPTVQPTRSPTRSPTTKGSPVSSGFCGDVLFLIDHSESVSSAGWLIVVDTVMAMIRKASGGRFAAIGYGSVATTFFSLTSKAKALSDMMQLRSSWNVQGATHLRKALDLGLKTVIPKMTSKYKLVVIVTDGIPSSCVCPSTTTRTRNNPCRNAVNYGKKLRAAGVASAIVGLGNGALVSLATNPQTCLMSASRKGGLAFKYCTQCFKNKGAAKAFEKTAASLICSADIVHPLKPVSGEESSGDGEAGEESDVYFE